MNLVKRFRVIHIINGESGVEFTALSGKDTITVRTAFDERSEFVVLGDDIWMSKETGNLCCDPKSIGREHVAAESEIFNGHSHGLIIGEKNQWILVDEVLDNPKYEFDFMQALRAM